MQNDTIANMERYEELYKAALKNAGLSVTDARLEVFEKLYAFGLQTMKQLVSRCSVDRASVYRTVNTLEACGIIIRVHQGFKYKIELSDMFFPHHHHIVCTHCGKHTDFEQEKLEQQLSSIADSIGYTLSSHKVELSGICTDCTK